MTQQFAQQRPETSSGTLILHMARTSSPEDFSYHLRETMQTIKESCHEIQSDISKMFGQISRMSGTNAQAEFTHYDFDGRIFLLKEWMLVVKKAVQWRHLKAWQYKQIKVELDYLNEIVSAAEIFRVCLEEEVRLAVYRAN